MITLAHPWLLLLVPLPFLIARFLPEYREGRSSLRIPRISRLAELTGQLPATGAVTMRRSTVSWIVLMLVWASALLAVARPQLIGDPVTKTIPSRDMLLAVDLSGSMNTEDFTDADGNQVNRLTACKQVLDEFLTRREGDRVGLIFFGSAAFVQSPFTEDLDLCRTLLDEAQVGMAGPQTVIGDAVGLSLTLFERSEQEDRVLIVLTDGNDTGSKVPPQEAARIARDKGVTIHTIAVGDPEAVGEEKIDEEVLRDMASQTGGGFYRADDRNQLEDIYRRLDELDTRELETIADRPQTDLFYWPLAAFLLLSLAWHGSHAARQSLRAQRNMPAIAVTVAVTSVLMFAGSSSLAPRTSALFNSFHFLRPAWLLGLIPITLIVLAILRKQDASRQLGSIIDGHLLRHLVVLPHSNQTLRPVHGLALAWVMATVALAGPTWLREPAPFASDQATLVFVQEVTPTMLAEDIQPSRLQRSVHKIRDLLALRPGAKAGLIAYAGSAHLVMPMTADAEIIEWFAGNLDPAIMPRKGDSAAEAIALANEQLQSAGTPGSIVLITDGIDGSQNQQLAETRQAPVHILAVAGDQSKPLPPGSPPAPAIDMAALQASADAAGSTLTLVTPDESDVQTLSRNITTSFVAAQQEDEGARWKDPGYWLTPLIALITLFWFRRGWIVNWD
ncbi:MAG: VWA domain-containing protein [Pirellulaceae bacterium]